VLQKWCLPRLDSRLIQSLQYEGSSWQPRPAGKEQKKYQQYRYVDRNRAEGMSCDRILHIERYLRPRKIIVPAALITKTKAASQNIRTMFCMISNADSGSIAAIGRHRVLAFGGIEIKICFHTAGEDIQVRFAARPKRFNQALPPLRGCLNKGAAPPCNFFRTGTCSKAVTCKLVDPRRFAPLNPHALGGHM